MNSYLTSMLRTYVPLAWGAALAWLVTVGVLDPGGALDAAPFGPAVLVPITTGAYYALVRLLESAPWWPRWLSALLLGAPAAPNYPASAEDAETVVRLHEDDVRTIDAVAAAIAGARDDLVAAARTTSSVDSATTTFPPYTGGAR